MTLKVFLTGRVAIESDGVLIAESRFPGRQGRLLFAYLRGRSIERRRRSRLTEPAQIASGVKSTAASQNNALWVPLFNGYRPDLVPKRVGNYPGNPQRYALLSQMWVR